MAQGDAYRNEVGRSEIKFWQDSLSGWDSLAVQSWAVPAFTIFQPAGTFCIPHALGRRRGLTPIADFPEP